MIVVVGSPGWRPAEPAGPAGQACAIALGAAAAGARIELVGRIGDDPAGDSLLIALAAAGVGHVAVLRDPARPTPLDDSAAVQAGAGPGLTAAALDPLAGGADADPVGLAGDDLVARPGPGRPRLDRADVALGLSYLTAFAVLVVADDAPPDVVPACVDGAAFAGAHLVIVVREGEPVPPALPASATVLEAPPEDDGAFARVVALFAAGLDRGIPPADAFREATAVMGWDAAGA